MLVVVLVLENPDRFAIRLTEQISSIGLFAVTESQCTENEHDDEDDSKFRNLGLVGYSEILAVVGDVVRVKVPEEEVGISVTDCGPLCKRASSVAKSQEQKPSPPLSPTRFPSRRTILNATTSPSYARRYTRTSSPRCFLYARVAAQGWDDCSNVQYFVPAEIRRRAFITHLLLRTYEFRTQLAQELI